MFWLFFVLIDISFGIEFQKQFTLQTNSYLELHNGFIKDVEINFSSGSIYGYFNINLLSDQNDPLSTNNSFDVFVFSNKEPKDVEGILCYKKAIIDGNFAEDCAFLKDKNSISYLFRKNYTVDFFALQSDLQGLDTFKYTYFIDNTQFPKNGAFAGQDLLINSIYNIEVESSMAYFFRTIGVAVSLGVILLIFVVGLLYLMIKYKEVKKKYKEEIMNLNLSERSFTGRSSVGKNKMVRVGSRDRNDSCEESKGESSVNYSLNAKKNTSL